MIKHIIVYLYIVFQRNDNKISRQEKLRKGVPMIERERGLNIDRGRSRDRLRRLEDSIIAWIGDSVDNGQY